MVLTKEIPKTKVLTPSPLITKYCNGYNHSKHRFSRSSSSKQVQFIPTLAQKRLQKGEQLRKTTMINENRIEERSLLSLGNGTDNT